jgi:hypothetical protein
MNGRGEEIDVDVEKGREEKKPKPAAARLTAFERTMRAKSLSNPDFDELTSSFAFCVPGWLCFACACARFVVGAQKVFACSRHVMHHTRATFCLHALLPFLLFFLP